MGCPPKVVSLLAYRQYKQAKDTLAHWEFKLRCISNDELLEKYNEQYRHEYVMHKNNWLTMVKGEMYYDEFKRRRFNMDTTEKFFSSLIDRINNRLEHSSVRKQ